MRSVGCVAIVLLVGGCGSNNYDSPLYLWSDDGACGVPFGYVGLDETVTDDGGCTAATWCPIDSSPTCVSPPSEAGLSTMVDAGSEAGISASIDAEAGGTGPE
jgi:hypothetical protein